MTGGRARGPWWRLFTSNGVKYKSNTTYQAAWCKSCIDHHMSVNRRTDAALLEAGEITAVRSEQELQRLAFGRAGYTELQNQQFPFTDAEDAKAVEPVCGRAESMASHARGCAHRDQDEVDAIAVEHAAMKQARSGRANCENTAPATSTSHSTSSTFGTCSQSVVLQPPLKRARTSGVDSSLAYISEPFVPSWDRDCQKLFGDDLAKVFAANSMPWNIADNFQFRGFLHKWLPSAHVPSRRALSGSHLRRAAKEADNKAIERLSGRYAMGQCDGWKSIAKTSLVSSVMSVDFEPHLVATHNMNGEPKTGDRMFELIKGDIGTMEAKYDVEVIGWCTDDGPDGKRARRLLLEAMYWLIVILCWAHQIQLVVGDLFKLSDLAQLARDAVEVIKWFTSHGVALDLLGAEQRFDNPHGPVHVLILPAATRWASHFHAFSRLLDMQPFLDTCVSRHARRLRELAGTSARDESAREKVEWVMRTIRDESFWRRLEKLKGYLEPLAVASNVTQGSDTRLDHVLLTLGHLHKVYSGPDIDEQVRDKVLGSLERRWKAADQDVFILTIFLNPYIRHHVFNKHALTVGQLIEMARYAFKRFFKVDPIPAFTTGLIDYANGRAEFSTTAMLLDHMRTEAVRANKRVNVKTIWELANASNAGESQAGRGGIAQLALRLFSVVANSGDCERTFSNFGNVVTKHRVHLAPKKVHLATQVKLHLQKCHQASDVGEYIRKKRKFSQRESEDSESDAEADNTPTLTASSSTATTVANTNISSSPPSEHGPPEHFIEEEDFNDMLQTLIDPADQAGHTDHGEEDGTEPSAEAYYHHPDTLPFSAGPSVDVLAQSLLPVNLTARRTKTNIPLSRLFLFTDPLPAPGQAPPPPTARLNLFWEGGTAALERDRALFERMQPHNQ